jgi:guanylate kinase
MSSYYSTTTAKKRSQEEDTTDYNYTKFSWCTNLNTADETISPSFSRTMVYNPS